MTPAIHGAVPIDCRAASREFRDFGRIAVADVPQKGSTRLYVGALAPPAGTYWLGSDIEMEEAFCPDGEIITVLRRRNGFIYLDRPFARTWHGPAVLVKVPILPELNLDGGEGLLRVCLAERVRIMNWTVSAGWEGQRGVGVFGFRDIYLRNVTVHAPIRYDSGFGYGIQLMRGSDAVVEDCVGVGTRHVNVCQGVADSAFRCLRAEAPMADGIDFDHGFGSETLFYEDCDSGGSNGAVGNRFKWGSHDITIRNHRNCRDLLCYGNSSCRIEGGQFSGALRAYANQAGRDMKIEVVRWPFAKGFREENAPLMELTVKSEPEAVAGGG